MESFWPIIQFLLPEFILENFELTSIDRPQGVFHVYIEEKNADQTDPERKNLLSKGFFPVITVQDFPIRGQQVFLHIKRRRWLNTRTGKVVYRDWTQVADGTRMTSEFARSAVAGFFKTDQSIPTRLAFELLVDFMALVAKPCCVNTVIVNVALRIGINGHMPRTDYCIPKIWVRICRWMKQAYHRLSSTRF